MSANTPQDDKEQKQTIPDAAQEAASILSKSADGILGNILSQSNASKDDKKEADKTKEGAEKKEAENADGKADASDKKEDAQADKGAVAKADEEKTGDDPKPDEDAQDHDKEKPNRRKGISPDRIAKLVGQGVREAMRKDQDDSPEKPKDPAKKPTERQWPAELKHLADTLPLVQEMHPEKYAGRDLVEELAAKVDAERKYERAWRKENPGAAFSWKDEEHEDFIAKNAIDVTRQELEDAEVEIKARAIEERAMKRVHEREQERLKKEEEKSKRYNEVMPSIQAANSDFQLAIVDAIDPEIGAEARKNPQAAIDRLKEDDLAVPVIKQIAQWAAPAMNAALAIANDIETPDLQNNESHKALRDVALSIDADITKGIKAKTKDGKRIVSIREYDKMDEDDREDVASVANANDLPGIIQAFAALEAKDLITAERQRYARYEEKMRAKQSKETPAKETKAEPQKQETKTPAVKATTAPPASKTNAESKDGLPNAFWSNLGLRASA